MKAYISIKIKSVIYNLFLIGYTKDGGFFIKDLLPGSVPSYISKVRIKGNTPGEQQVKRDLNYEWVASNSPKLTHHADGRAQVSGTGVVSGFYRLTGKAKGVHVMSMDLAKNDNDGGPIFTVMIWGLDVLNQEKKNGQIVFSEDDVREGLSVKFGNPGYLIEGYYAPKALEVMVDPVTGFIIKKHPNYGDLALKKVPAPDNAPGFLAVGCFKIKHGFPDEYGHIINGAPGFGDASGHYETLWIMRPTLSAFIKNPPQKSLDLSSIDKFIFKVDRLIGNCVELLKGLKSRLQEIFSTHCFKLSLSWRLKFTLMHEIDNVSEVKKLLKLINALLSIADSDRYRTLFFYSRWISNPDKKDSVAVSKVFSDLSSHTTSPLFKHPQKTIEEDLNRITSLDNLKKELALFIEEWGLPNQILRKKTWHNFTSCLKSCLRTNPIVVREIPNAIVGTNIQTFVLSHYSPVLRPFPNTLYALTYLFSSDFPLSVVVEGSIEN